MPVVTMVEAPYAAIDGADIIAIVTNWDMFCALDFARIKSLAKVPILADLRNMCQPVDMCEAGYDYACIVWG